MLTVSVLNIVYTSTCKHEVISTAICPHLQVDVDEATRYVSTATFYVNTGIARMYMLDSVNGPLHSSS